MKDGYELRRLRAGRFLSTAWSLGMLAGLGLPLSVSAADEAGKLPERIRRIDPLVAAAGPKAMPADELRSALSRSIRVRRDQVNRRDVENWRQLDSRADWEAFRDQRLSALDRSLGQFPEPPETLRVEVKRTLQSDGYQIQNIVFESRPGLRVTANLYRPDDPGGSMPGILICHSHHNPKTQSELQDMGGTWARAGCVVLVMDQLGHGERRQHPFRTAADYEGEFRVSRQDYYFRYNIGIQLHLIGDSLMGWMVYDLRRGVDLLLQTEGVDPRRIALLGAVAGGGDPCGVAAALDDRITVAVPFNFGGPQPETRFPLPDDADLAFNYVGGGSWESTRNLQRSGHDGFLPWLIVGSIAPRRLIYAHEFSWDQQRDPVWRRLQAIYGWYDASDHLGSLHGYGKVTLSSDKASHCNNIGSYHRGQIDPLFARWFKISAEQPGQRERRSSEELLCHTATDAPLPPARVLADKLAAERLRKLRTALNAKPAGQRAEHLRQRWSRVLGLETVVSIEHAAVELSGPRSPLVERLTVTHRDLPVPIMLLALPQRERPSPCVVGIAQQGKAGFLEHRAEEIGELLEAGVIVCLVDLPGTGETSAGDYRGRRSAATGLSSSRLMLGGSVLGDQLDGLLSVVDWIKRSPAVDPDAVAVWGESFAAANEASARVEFPLGISEEARQAEPGAALLALLAGLFDDRLAAVAGHGGLVSFRSALESPFIAIPHDYVIPGAIPAGDIPDLATALARPVRFSGMVTGVNRPASGSEQSRYWNETHRELVTIASDSRGVAPWLIRHLKH